jgi:predicted dehydrogenase
MPGIALVGTGFVADFYVTTLHNYTELNVVGAWDRNEARLAAFCAFHNIHAFSDLAAVLADPAVEIVINLTTPESHFEINKAALEADKHVYCEKPLAMSVEEAEQLVVLAERRNRTLCAAPANALSDAFQLTRDLLASGRIGTPRLVYAEMEDGAVFRANWREWKSRSGAPWPGVHEFEVGCTLEHVGYGLSWLVGLFGVVSHVTAFSALTHPDKGPGTEHLHLAPDFSVGCLTFANGLVARMTCGLAASRDRSLAIMGDAGMITVRDLWDNRSPVNLAVNDERTIVQKFANRVEHERGRVLPLRLTPGRRVAYPRNMPKRDLPAFPSQIDFARGIHKQAEAIRTGTKPFFSGRMALHLTELALMLNAGACDYTPLRHPERS